MKFLLTLSFYVLAFFTTSANASDKHDIQPSLTMNAHSSVADALSLDVFKSPTCGCCQKWIDHIELSGFKATAYLIVKSLIATICLIVDAIKPIICLIASTIKQIVTIKDFTILSMPHY